LCVLPCCGNTRSLKAHRRQPPNLSIIPPPLFLPPDAGTTFFRRLATCVVFPNSASSLARGSPLKFRKSFQLPYFHEWRGRFGAASIFWNCLPRSGPCVISVAPSDFFSPSFRASTPQYFFSLLFSSPFLFPVVIQLSPPRLRLLRSSLTFRPFQMGVLALLSGFNVVRDPGSANGFRRCLSHHGGAILPAAARSLTAHNSECIS